MLSIAGAIGAGTALGGINGAINASNAALGSVLGNYFGKKSRRDSLGLSKDYDSWYLENIYKPQAEFDYSLAGRYAQNSALWDVIGLKKAGLNPILAAGGGFSGGSSYSAPSMGSANFGSDTPSVDLGKLDIAEATRDIASADLAETQADVASSTQSSLVSSAKSDAQLKAKNVQIAEATKSKIDAERSQIEANTARTLAEIPYVGRPKNWLGETAEWVLHKGLLSPLRGAKDLYDTFRLFYPSESPHSARDSRIDSIEVNTGKRQSDFERTRLEILKELSRKVSPD